MAGGSNPSQRIYKKETQSRRSSAVEQWFCKPSVIRSNRIAGSYPKNISIKTMSQENLIKLECSQCHRINYYSRKNKKIKTRLELKKHCKWCRKHTMHKETK